MKLATYNVENLFQRAHALNLGTWNDGKDILEKFTELNDVFNRANYTAADKARIVQLITDLGLAQKDDGSDFVLLRQNKGKLLVRHNTGVIEVVAGGRSDWVGWLDLKVADVDEVATRNTARIINLVNADVLALCEVESRPAIVHFSDLVIPAVGGQSYAHAMVIDGNDDRGIDVGIMTRDGYTIDWMQSHVDDTDDVGEIFSRDCAEYVIRTPAGNELYVLVNHLKSKGFGSQNENDKKRKRQAVRVKKIYEDLVAAGVTNIAVVGDFNDVVTNAPLAPLQDTDLKDISAHPSFVGDGRAGTFANGTAGEKIDYILLSPALFAKVTAGGVERRGVWGGVNGTLFPHLPEITKAGEAASDHAALFAELDL
jgi:endonuclease/exonuclease/phosphatase family metal-dependent hydrolase